VREVELSTGPDMPDARGRRLGDQSDLLLGLLDHGLAPYIDVVLVRLDIGEIADPPVDAVQVERRRRDEVDGCLVTAEETADGGRPP
jgi:hypothetical protein